MIQSINDPEIQKVIDAARKPAHRIVNVGIKPVTIQTPFPSPGDWRDLWIYFLMIDRFNNPVRKPAFHPWDQPCDQFQGGTFSGVWAQLDYLQGMGVKAIWLSPVFKNCQFTPYTYHGYGIQNFLTVDPRFASDPAKARKDPTLAENELRLLVDQIHARGMYVIFDIVLNHTGDVFSYPGFGAAAPWSDQPYPIEWRDENGQPRSDWSEAPAVPAPDAAVWPTELRRNEFFRRQGRVGPDEKSGDFESLKDLVTEYTLYQPDGAVDHPVREILIRAYQYAIARYDVDGFRIDTLKFVEQEFAVEFADAMREFADTIGKNDFYMVGEVYDSEDKISDYVGRKVTSPTELVGVDAALDYPLFFYLPQVIKGSQPPSVLQRVYDYRSEIEKNIIGDHGDPGDYFVTFLDNHDQNNRFYYVDPVNPHRYDDQLEMGLALLFTLQGIPCIYYGTEQGLHGLGNRPECVREALWGKHLPFDRFHKFYRVIGQLSQLREENPALRFGRQYIRPISGNGIDFGVSQYPFGVIAFARILSDVEITVVANTNLEQPWTGEVIVDYELNQLGSLFKCLYSNREYSFGLMLPPVLEKAADDVFVVSSRGNPVRGAVRTVSVSLEPAEIRVLKNVR
ncbi:MAG TPA: alpha-amylase family glycosyl hydrolase [Anaerolineaceae bacterium]|nr:alpha-amylase family glycosyl hydrolase [Anaerolineaceae bacterium]